jgi:hypothetical protein
MSSSDAVNWQPISQMPLIATMIDSALSYTKEHLQTLTAAQAQPHVLDDATVDRSVRVHTEQLAFVDIYDRQLRRWQAERPSVAQKRELDRLETQNRHLREVTVDVLATAQELRKGARSTASAPSAAADPEPWRRRRYLGDVGDTDTQQPRDPADRLAIIRRSKNPLS